MTNADFCEGRTKLYPGDVLVIYSDGVSEATNPSGEEFGPTRLYETVARNLDASAGGIRDRIESALTKFCQGTPAADDITLVIVKRLAEAAEVAVAAGQLNWSAGLSFFHPRSRRPQKTWGAPPGT